ncbi:MAG TPA: hypothetical protein VN213_14390 [Solirubrobacteraceae bacterium]|nr:hypothetical protein [Solirubrobacteraceae bacterium]
MTTTVFAKSTVRPSPSVRARRPSAAAAPFQTSGVRLLDLVEPHDGVRRRRTGSVS